MTKRSQIISLLLLVVLVLGNGEVPKPSYTRTMLKVSRSLPGETEELKVRTSEGNLATLIVKRRDKSSFAGINDSKLTKLSQVESNVTAANNSDLSSASSESAKLGDDRNAIKKRNEVRRLEEAQVEQIRAAFAKSSAAKDERANVSRTSETKRPSPTERNRSVSDSVIDYGNWTPLSADGRALKETEPSKDEDEEEYRNWKPLQTNLDSSTEERTDYDGYHEGFGILLASNLQDRAQRNLGFEDRSDKSERAPYYTYVPLQSTRTNVGANLLKNRDGKAVPPEVIVRSEINVKAVPKRSAMSVDSDGTPVIHGTRVPDEPIDKIQTWRNARVINNKLISEGSPTAALEPSVGSYSDDNAEKKQRFDKFFKDINRRYGRNYDEEGRNVYFEWDPRNYKNDALKAEVYETRNAEQYRASVHKRMLHPDGIASYPISQRYASSGGQTIAPVVLKTGARAPVLQYAHPELGVQPAKILKNEKRRPDNFPESQHSFTEQRHKKKYVLNDKNIVDSYTTKNYYPNQHFYGLKRPNEPPFWVKISENLKNQFSNGVEKVSQFTRPVIDPLVEATHKISQNLGLSQKGKEAQNKIDTVATGTSILIPALGLVASGAALGIGAVAVGRYLDVDVLKRSNADDLDLEHKRALEAGAYLTTIDNENVGSNEAVPPTLYVFQNVPRYDNADKDVSSLESDGVLLVVENDKQNDERIEKRESRQMVDEGDYLETSGRRKRSLEDYLDIFKMENDMRNLVRSKRFQRKGADSISEIVEIDLPSEGRIDIAELLIPKRSKERHSNENTVLVVEDGSRILAENQNALQDTARIIGSRDVDDDPQNAASTVLLRQGSRQQRGGQVADGAFLALDDDTSRILESNLGKESDREIVQGSDETVVRDEDLGKNNKRQKRSIESDQELEDALQNLENAEVAEVAHIQGDWANTPCAKKIFCDTMIQRGPDAAMFMEKKMAALLRLIQPGTAVQVSSHFEEVMNAVRRHDCSSFVCPQTRPTNVFI